jgi:transposase
MYDITKLVEKKVFRELTRRLPTPKQKKRGRKRVLKEALLSGILQVLVNGVAWGKIADCGCGYASCWRYFKELQRRGKLKLIYEELARKKTDVVEGAIDTTTSTSFRFQRMTGWDGKHKKTGTKISIFSDKNGLPADVLFGKGSRHDTRFLSNHIEKTALRRKRILNLDKGYTSLDFRREMRKKGTKINMQTRTGDYTAKRGPKFRFDKLKYHTRFLVEKLIGWLKNFWRIRIRRDRLPAMYKAFVYLGLIIILLRY